MSSSPDASQRHPVRRPILLRIGALMAVIVVLAIAAMVGSIVIAQINQGMAAAVNQSGTLRMQSYRIGMALADQRASAQERWQRAQTLAAEQSRRLASPRLTHSIPAAPDDPVRIAYEQVLAHWDQVMRPAVDAARPGSANTLYLDQVDGFVDQIHRLVRALEDRSEQRIDLLRRMQGAALGLTIGVVLLTLWLLRRRVMRPLEELLRVADRARQGDFSARTDCVGADELGRLGAAMNLMTQGLWQIYNELEERVAEKTRDLARSNHSLQLLYRTSRMLDGSAISDSAFREVLLDLKRQLKLRAATLCLREGWRDAELGGSAGLIACVGAPTAFGRPGNECPEPDCRLGLRSATAADPSRLAGAVPDGDHRPIEGQAEQPAVADARTPTIDFPVADQGRRYGTLRVVPGRDGQLEPWQVPLLEALASQLATALNLQGRLRESRRLVLHEERSILARELHDSLAQSLSYLKIQAVRLEAALSGKTQGAALAPEAIVAEMREGISSAYRQLRELLTTFRLKVGGEGLASALAETVDDFRLRADLEIKIEDRLAAGVLSPNEEVHVLQIVREALSNATRHARAGQVQVRLETDPQSGEVSVEIIDDGIGLGAEQSRRGHYGLTIMRERAASLGGTIRIEPNGLAGTAVRLRFHPRLRRRSTPERSGSAASHSASELRQ